MTRKRSPSFQFYADDFLAGTFSMTTLEVGAYIRLLCLQWAKGLLPSDDRNLLRNTGLTQPELDECKEVLLSKFERNEDGMMFNARLEAVRAVQLARAESGSKGGSSKRQAKRKQKKRAQGDGDGDGVGDGKGVGIGDRNCNRNRNSYPPEFEIFWRVYPSGRKEKKGDALKAWQSAVKIADPEKIIAAAREYAASPKGRGKYTKMPATWLNGRCWDDDREAWQQDDDMPERTRRNLKNAAGFVNGENLF